MTLDDLDVGEKACVLRIETEGPLKKRLLEMGFTKGAVVEVVKYAPLKDPVEYRLKGYHVSLRHEEAAKIMVELVKDHSSPS